MELKGSNSSTQTNRRKLIFYDNYGHEICGCDLDDGIIERREASSALLSANRRGDLKQNVYQRYIDLIWGNQQGVNQPLPVGKD